MLTQNDPKVLNIYVSLYYWSVSGFCFLGIYSTIVDREAELFLTDYVSFKKCHGKCKAACEAIECGVWIIR